MEERKKFEIIKQVSEVIRENLLEPSTIFTVVDLTLPKKGGVMKIYLSVFPEKKEKEFIQFLTKNSFKIKKAIIKRVFLRYLPKKIIFYSSTAIKEADKVLKLINEIEKKDSTSKKRTEN